MPSNGLDAAEARREAPAAPDSRVDFIRTITHPVRTDLLGLLAREGAATAAQLAALTRRPRGSISYHLDVLERCGAVERVMLPAQRARTYRATVRTVIEDDEWAELPVSLRRQLVARDLGHIGRETHAAMARGGFDHPEAHISWIPFPLDSDGLEQMAALLRETVGRALAIAADVKERRADDGHDEVETEIAILHFVRDADERAPIDPPRELLTRLYALTDRIGEVVPESRPDWQGISDRAFELGTLAQRYGAASSDTLA